MRKIAFSLALVATAFSAPAMAADKESTTFSHDGIEYSYEVKSVGSKQLVTGTASTGDSFRLLISDKYVRGTYDGQPVSFSRDSVEPLSSVFVAQR